jgi:outer membrane protein OmpA-like peptidoglycan-associated protein
MRSFLYIVVLAVALAACGTASKIKYAEKLYSGKAFAEAAKVCESIKEDSPEKSKLLALSYFEILKMELSAAEFAKVPEENLTPEEKLKYCEALRQSGQTAQSSQLASRISNTDGGADIDFYRNPYLAQPEAEIKVYPEEFNTDDDEMTPFYYKGQMFYLSNHQTKWTPNNVFPWNGKPYLQIVDSTGSSNNAFKKINSQLHDGPASVSEEIDGILFNRNYTTKGHYYSGRITIHQKKLSTLKNGKSEEIDFFASPNNYLHPFLSSNGGKLYYASDGGDSKGGMDLYYVIRNEDGSCQEPKSLGDNVNSAYNELYPTLLNDSILIFASNRPSGFGGLDLYASTLDRDGVWGKPRLLDMPLNSIRDDFYLIESMDTNGKYYFTTNRDGNDNIYSAFIPKTLVGGWDVILINAATQEVMRGDTVKTQYEVSSIPSDILVTDDSGAIKVNAKGGTLNVVAKGYKQSQASYAYPKHGYFKTVSEKLEMVPVSEFDLNGIVRDETSNEALDNVTVKIIGVKGIDSLTTDQTGSFTHAIDLIKFEKGSLVDIVLERPGYRPKTISGVKLESNGTQLDLSAVADLRLKKIKVGDDLGAILAIKPIYFETGKWDITPQGAIELDKIADILLDNPAFVIECGSHTDCRSSRKSNQDLSSKRANSTVQYLINKGVSAVQLKYKGYGEDQPVNDCRCEGSVKTTCSEEELALNRRTEFKVISGVDTANNTKPASASSDSIFIGATPPINEINEPRAESEGISPEVQALIKNNEPLVQDVFVIGSKARYTSFDSFENTGAMPAGAVYMVQVGAFVEDVDTDIFTGLEPIYIEKTQAGFTRYCVGMFTAYSKAEAAMHMLQKRGFTDAFIVGYWNGVRVPVQELHNR